MFLWAQKLKEGLAPQNQHCIGDNQRRVFSSDGLIIGASSGTCFVARFSKEENMNHPARLHIETITIVKPS